MIWIIGNKGMLGTELSEEFKQAGLDFCGTDREVSILEPEALKEYAEAKKPDWIVNCSAYTAVEKAEEESELAYALNRDGAGNIGKLSAELGIPVIHISTDYVFDGSSSTPLSEEAQTEPVSVYGRSKLEGENAITASNSMHFIIRTAWLYGQYGPNFVFTMIKLMNSRESIKVVNDQHGSPTWTRLLTGLISKIIQSDSREYGLYHLSGENQCTWFDFASEIYKLGSELSLITSECNVATCTSDEFPAKVKRPEYSLLSKEKVKKVFGYQVESWQESLEKFLKECNKLFSRVENWIEHAEYDIETASSMHDSGRYLYVLITVQQCIEKALKALYEYNGISVPRIHDLLRLANGFGIKIEEERKELFNDLSYYYIASKYGERIKSLSKDVDKTRSAYILENGKEIYQWLKSMIPFV